MVERRRDEDDPAKVDVPVELTDRDADVWRDQAAYVSYMEARAYTLDVRTRLGALVARGLPLHLIEMGDGPSPEHRRRRAVEEWARDAGIVDARFPAFVDWHRLKAMGLL